MVVDLIRYDILAQEALRSVVAKVLTEVARAGLPGEHHFYISINTTYPGVKISPLLLSKHPENITIVLQHQFWDLKVTDESFAVGLSFGGVKEYMSIPFAAIIGFRDPSANFMLQFNAFEEDSFQEGEAEDADESNALDDSQDESGLSTSQNEPVEPENEENDANIVSLDVFRKKK